MYESVQAARRLWKTLMSAKRNGSVRSKIDYVCLWKFLKRVYVNDVIM